MVNTGYGDLITTEISLFLCTFSVQQDFDQPLSSEDWDRLYRYTWAIKNAHFSYWKMPVPYSSFRWISPSPIAFSTLASPQYSSGDTCIFPALRSWRGEYQMSKFDVSSLSLFVSRQIERVELSLSSSFDEPTHGVAPLLLELLADHPIALRHFELACDDNVQNIMPGLERISTLPYLEHFVFNSFPISHQVLLNLGRLRHLNYLFVEQISFPSEAPRLSQNAFPQLKTFLISNLPDTTALLLYDSGFSPKSLQSIFAGTTNPPNFNSFGHLITSSGDQMHNIECSGWRIRLRFEDLQILTPLANLQSLDISGVTYLELDDNELEEVIRHLRHLRKWRTLVSRLPGSRHMPTLLSIGNFLRHCPKLRSLTLTMNATVLPTGSYPTHPIFPPLTDSFELDVGLSILKDPEAVVQWLNPWLKGFGSIGFRWNWASPFAVEWRGVYEFLKFFDHTLHGDLRGSAAV